MEKEDDEMKLEKIAKITGVVAGAILSEGGRKFLCGTYSDGTPRSLQDALNDELYSPEERKKRLKKLQKKKKKKKNKKTLGGYDGTFRL